MNRGLGLALLAIGVILLFYGINAEQSFTSSVSKVFTGAPTDRSIFLIAGGVLAALVGLFLTMRGGRG
jgi:uncharacterized membrane protein YidH (DUF202 family)